MAHLTLDFVLDSLSRQVATSVKYIIIPRGSRSHLFTEVALQIVASVADLIWVFLPTGSHDGRAGGRVSGVGLSLAVKRNVVSGWIAWTLTAQLGSGNPPSSHPRIGSVWRGHLRLIGKDEHDTYV